MYRRVRRFWGILSMAFFGVAVTVLMWSTLASCVVVVGHLPPLFVNGIALTVGGLLGLPWARDWRMPPLLAVAGSAGMFAYHVVYFYALQLGDPVGVSLIHYLWPILIVILSPVFTRDVRIGRRHLVPAALGFAGAILACFASWSTASASAAGPAASGIGHAGIAMTCVAYALALLSAFAWAAYSLLGTRYRQVPSHCVGLFCLSAGLACLALCFSRSSWPHVTMTDAGVLMYMGLGPMGGAFYLWDFAMKRGDPRKTAVLSYAIPVVSTLFLSAYLRVPMTATLWAGALLVTVSVSMASRSHGLPRD
jgi:drug/metabolite transporter (DMT)-like permease